MTKPHLIFISQLAIPGYFPAETYQDAPGGDDETVWVDLILKKAGIRDQITYSGCRITHGDSLPDLCDADAFIIGGSYHNVADQFPFQRDLIAWIRAARGSAKPLFGICGGHQLMASALGARVENIPGGPMAASLPVTLTSGGKNHFLFDDIHSDLRFHFGNYQHVVDLPEGASILAFRPEMPVMVLDYGDNWYSCQYHPEAHQEIFSSAWMNSHPEYVENYVELPLAPLMLRNFITGCGILSGDKIGNG